MKNKTMIEIIDADGLKQEVELITFLNSEDEKRDYVVYTKGETQGTNGDKVIYISRFYKENGELKTEEITEDSEWVDIQHLLKKIANATN